MTNYTKGGRGKKAPYETTHRRIPVRIKPLVERVITKFRDLIDEPEKFDKLEQEIFEALSDSKDDTKLKDQPITKEEALELAKKLMRARRSKKETVEKLVSGIYGGDISLD